jgi:serine/threonine-protein kinase
MGEVYLARQLSLDRMVALKLLSVPGPCRATRRTVRAGDPPDGAALEHPYLVTAFEAGEDAGVLYLAMAYVRAPRSTSTSGTAARCPSPTRWCSAENWLRRWRMPGANCGCCTATSSPPYILLDSNGEPRLADLGLAKCLDQNDGRPWRAPCSARRTT